MLNVLRRFSKGLDVGIGLVLLVSSLMHLSHPFKFLEAVYNYRLVGIPLVAPVAALIPWLQLVLAMCLLVGVFRIGALFLALCLFQLFTIAQLTAWVRGLNISCGCFGSGEDLISASSIGLAQGLGLACLVSIWFNNRNSELPRASGPDARLQFPPAWRL